MSEESSLFRAAAACLLERDPERKRQETARAAGAWQAGMLELDDAPVVAIDVPGRPERPALVPPRDLPRRSLNEVAGRAALIHAVAHIEFNAINLAWDAVQRFRGLPRAFYDDWVGVANEEAMHFGLMRERLNALGYDYGDLPAHDGLWGMAMQTAHDPLVRMALVPRVMEARGLDVTPGMIERLRAAGDEDTAERLGVILRDELGHVAAGSRWFKYLCGERGLDPETTFFDLLERHLSGGVRGPFNLEARASAGFDRTELDRLEDLARGGR